MADLTEIPKDPSRYFLFAYVSGLIGFSLIFLSFFGLLWTGVLLIVVAVVWAVIGAFRLHRVRKWLGSRGRMST